MQKQKKILVFGYGVTGKSIISFLVKKSHKITLIENNKLKKIDKNFLEENHIKVINDEKNIFNELNDYECCYVSPGVDLRLPFFEECKKNKLELRNDTYFLSSLSEKKIKLIAITGTNGKTTFCTLLHNLFSKFKITSDVAGNIGKPIIDVVQKLKDEKFLILELSSYQIELLPKNIKFDYGVILNITPDHLDRYENFEHYKNVKLKLASHSNYILYDHETVPITNHINSIALQKESIRFGENTDGEYFEILKNKRLEKFYIPHLRGKHNALNILTIDQLLGQLNLNINFDKFKDFFKDQVTLPHRFEFVCKLNNVSYINDSKATNIASTVSALNSIQSKIHLIFGGELKKQPLKDLEKLFNKKLVSLNIIGVDGDKILDYINNFQINFRLNKSKTLDEALFEIRKILKPSEVVLLSPGCASKDMFKDYQDRGDHFKNLVKGII